jgi:ribonuclease HII
MAAAGGAGPLKHVPAKSPSDRFQHERELLAEGAWPLAGVDEAGRGPLAGPVVAAAVIFPESWIRDGLPEALRRVNDSKQLSETAREELFAEITARSEIHFTIAEADAGRIDRINILQATHWAMNEALRGLATTPQHVLVDGLKVKSLIHPQTPLVKGDSRSYSIAAASILAKVTRDRLMVRYDAEFPGYGFAVHKGYPTPAHLDALRRLGPTPIHRRSFAPLKAEQIGLL